MSFIEKTDANAFVTVYTVHKIIKKPKEVISLVLSFAKSSFLLLTDVAFSPFL